jgi:hypothetical protein
VSSKKGVSILSQTGHRYSVTDASAVVNLSRLNTAIHQLYQLTQIVPNVAVLKQLNKEKISNAGTVQFKNVGVNPVVTGLL